MLSLTKAKQALMTSKRPFNTIFLLHDYYIGVVSHSAPYRRSKLELVNTP